MWDIRDTSVSCRPPSRRQGLAPEAVADQYRAVVDACDPDPVPVRRRRAALAGHSGDETTLRALLADPAPSVRSTALSGLERLGDDDTTVAEMAAWAAGEQPDRSAGTVDALAAMATGHRDPLCREAAVA